MPTTKTIILAFALFASFAQAGQTQPVKPAQPTTERLPGQLSMERWFVGSWICEGTEHDSPTAPAMKFTDKFTFRMELDGSWLSYTIDQTQGPHAGQRNLVGWGTWDTNAKVHIRRDMNIGGGRVDVTSPGWQGDKLVFAGYMISGTGKLPITHTITRKGDAEYDAALVVTAANGKPVNWEDESCNKVAN